MLPTCSRRVLAVFACCVVLLTVGALPAAAFPGFGSSSDSGLSFGFEPGAWLASLWQSLGAPVASLFAADETPPPPTVPTPPINNVGITIDPDGTPHQ